MCVERGRYFGLQSPQLFHSMNYTVNTFLLFFSFCAALLARANAVSDLFGVGDNDNAIAPESGTVDDLDIFTTPQDDQNTADANAGLFLSSMHDRCSAAIDDEADNISLLPTGENTKARVRSRRAELCAPKDGELFKPDSGVPNFGLLNPSSNLLEILTPPPKVNPAKRPTQIFQPPGGENDVDYLERVFNLAYPSPDLEKLCPRALVFDLGIPVCHSGNWARDVFRQIGDYFFDLFDVRYCITSLRSRGVIADDFKNNMQIPLFPLV